MCPARLYRPCIDCKSTHVASASRSLITQRRGCRKQKQRAFWSQDFCDSLTTTRSTSVFLSFGLCVLRYSGDRSLQEIAMSFRILFDEAKLKQGLYQADELQADGNGAGWPKNTWFQKRLRHVREQQRKKSGETECVYECALGTVTIRSNGED